MNQAFGSRLCRVPINVNGLPPVKLNKPSQIRHDMCKISSGCLLSCRWEQLEGLNLLFYHSLAVPVNEP